MIRIDLLGNEYKQNFQQLLPNNEIYTLNVFFQRTDQQWYINLTYKDLQIIGRRLESAINLFDDKSNLLPYGLLVDAPSQMQLNDKNIFINNVCVLRIISYEEIESLRTLMYV